MNNQPSPFGQDDWDSHWRQFGGALVRNPAATYRQRLILSLVRDVRGDLRILDIGSGQGDLALLLSEEFPDAEVRGVENSRTGVEHSRLAAVKRGRHVEFDRRDLLTGDALVPRDMQWATVAICSEVLEHIDEPERLLRNAKPYLAPGCRFILTVPGGPRTAFDRHIGHRRHFSPRTLRSVLEAGGFKVEKISRSGFPFFNLYKLAVLVRGRSVIDEFNSEDDRGVSAVAGGFLRFFDMAFRWNLESSPLGWQLIATARATE